MDGICLTCGTFADLEAHHVAGRHNNMQLTVLVCVDCHRILTRWQYAAGIDLEEQSPRTELDVLRALAVGATHVLRLYAERHGEASPIPVSLAVHTARALSRLMDSAGDPDRSARSLPDPRVPPVDVVPVGPPVDNPRRVAEFADLVRGLTDLLGDQPPLMASVLGSIAADPEHFQQSITDLFEGPESCERLLQLVVETMTQGAAVVTQLLQLPDPRRIDPQLLEEARVWIDTGVRLLQQALATVLPTPHQEGQA